ncbi:MAG: N(4)-(beta-N-acetylglucosaminyl)-L-asparaginase [Pseudomonadales bacterium]
MADGINRRAFIGASAAVGASATAGCAAPAIRLNGPGATVIASGNGFVSRNADGLTCVELAFRRMTTGSDVLDALIAGVNIVELDPEDTSVGYGGLPDADGVVTLDSCCMHGPRRRAGGVGALQGVRTPSLVARAVADNTDHHLLVGEGAQRFARNLGFAIEDDLNTDRSRSLWLEWKRRTDPAHYPNPAERAAAARRVGREMVAEGKIDPEHYHGTINCSGVNAAGDVCGVTTTSGLAWKIPGRVGDSPILGAGLYVDNDVGAAGSTGRGEANLYSLASFLVVEFMRQGMHPKDAGMAALKRIQSQTADPRLLRENGNPDFNVNFYVLGRNGEHAGVAFYGGRNYAVCDEAGPRHVPIEGLLG